MRVLDCRDHASQGNAIAILAVAKLRSFALNILRKNKVDNVSLALFENCMNLDNILNYVGIL